MAPEMLFHEPRAGQHASHRHTVSKTDKIAGYSSGLLPSSLRNLNLHADTRRSDRAPTYWLDLIEDLLADQVRFHDLSSIPILKTNYGPHSKCSTCQDFGEKCSLCVKSKISDTMKDLRKQAGIALLIDKVAYPGRFELDDPDQYPDGILPYNDAFDIFQSEVLEFAEIDDEEED